MIKHIVFRSEAKAKAFAFDCLSLLSLEQQKYTIYSSVEKHPVKQLWQVKVQDTIELRKLAVGLTIAIIPLEWGPGHVELTPTPTIIP